MIDWLGRWASRWLDKRLRLAKFVRRAVNHVFPDHWSFMLGEIALYSFVILVITGTYLAMFFHSSTTKLIYNGVYRPLDGVQVSSAFNSVMHISFDVPAGLLMRQMHHWAALIFVAAIVAHMARLFFTAAFRHPREINWIVGVTLLLLAISNGYFGYSIGDDLLSGTGLRIGYAILLSVPLIGQWLAFLVFGATVPAAADIPRFYSLHIFLVPALLALLIAVHLSIIWRQYHTNYPGPRRTDRTIVGSRLWPSYAAKSVGLFFILFGAIAALGALVQIDPIWVYGPYEPTATLPGAQPDWYLGWIEGAMRLFPSVNLRTHYLVPNVFFSAMLLPILIFLGLYIYPWIDKLIYYDPSDRARNVLRMPWEQPFNTAFGCAVFIFALVLLFGGGDDVIAVAIGGSVVQIRTILRAIALGAPPLTFAIVYAICKRIKRGRDESRLATQIAVQHATAGMAPPGDSEAEGAPSETVTRSPSPSQ